jgi:hypothetical protein
VESYSASKLLGERVTGLVAGRVAFRRSGADPLGSFVDEHGRMQFVSAADIRAAIRGGAVMDNPESYGYKACALASHAPQTGRLR